jgi:hypothetical protein
MSPENNDAFRGITVTFEEDGQQDAICFRDRMDEAGIDYHLIGGRLGSRLRRGFLWEYWEFYAFNPTANLFFQLVRNEFPTGSYSS